MSLRIRRNDKVKVLTGKDKGKTGKVLHVYPQTGRALVEGVNLVKKHLRRSQQHPQVAVVSQEASIHMSNLALTDPQSSKPVRFRTALANDGSKSRVSIKTKAVIAS